MSLEPMSGYVLVELNGKYKNVSASSKVYESATEGIARAIAVEGSLTRNLLELVDKRVFWSDMMAGAPIVRDGKKYVFVRIERLEGFEDAEQ